MKEIDTVLQMDNRGRVMIPLAIRKALHVENKEALLNVKIVGVVGQADA